MKFEAGFIYYAKCTLLVFRNFESLTLEIENMFIDKKITPLGK